MPEPEENVPILDRPSDREVVKALGEPVVTVNTRLDRDQALLSKQILGENGVEAYILDDEYIGPKMYPSSYRPHIVVVRSSDEERARGIIQDFESEEAEFEWPEGMEPDPEPIVAARICPRCGSGDPELPRASWLAILSIVLLAGIPVFFIRRKFRCRSCGHFWKEPRSVPDPRNRKMDFG